MTVGTIQNLISTLKQAIKQLPADISDRDLEDLAVSIHKTLSRQTRYFHTLDHSLSLAEPNAPLRSLAAVFHDLVYFQVDQDFPSSVYAIISPYLVMQDNGDRMVGKVIERPFDILRALFDILPGQEISSIVGINEFFSALVAWKKLEHILSETLLFKIAVHIEATIPFCGQDEHNMGRFEALAKRIKRISQRYGILLSDMDIDETILSAVKFANQDVAGFAHPDPATFLDNTWKLLPEINAELRSDKIYSIRDYRMALQKMNAFFAWIEPQNIFHAYKGRPVEHDLQQMTATARRNIATAREYIGVKLLAIAILEALAEHTGGDTPLALFMGTVRVTDEMENRLEKYLPEITTPITQKHNATVYRLLALGRSGHSLFDLQNAPLAAYLYVSLGRDDCEALLPLAEEMFSRKRKPVDFLAAIDPQILSAIVAACAQMVPTRRVLLNRFAATIPKEG